MPSMDNVRRCLLLTLCATSWLLLTTWPSPAWADLHVAPTSVQMGAFFDGARIRVSAVIPQGTDAVVEVVGKRIEEQLLRKARHWDIWMNVGEIDIEEAPRLYFALSTDPGSLSRSDANAFGYAAMRQRVSFKGDLRGLVRRDIFREFIELKESEKLYRLLPGALKVSPALGDAQVVEGEFTVPSRIAPGEYRVKLSVVDHGRVLRTESVQLDVGMVGLPAFLTSLARSHGALYGLFAVVIAVIFGFIVGVVFRKGRRA